MRPDRDDGYDEFFRSVLDRAVRSADRVLCDRAAAEDAAVEALGRTYARWGKLKNDPYREQWVLRVAINLAIDEQRRRARQRRPDSQDVMTPATPPSTSASTSPTPTVE